MAPALVAPDLLWLNMDAVDCCLQVCARTPEEAETEEALKAKVSQQEQHMQVGGGEGAGEEGPYGTGCLKRRRHNRSSACRWVGARGSGKKGHMEQGV